MAGHRSRDLTPAVLTENEIRIILRVLIWITAAGDIGHGIGYVLGAPATAPSLVLMQAFVPMWAWGAALVLAGLLLPFRPTRGIGFALGGFVLLVWAAFSAAVLLPGVGLPATGWGWVPYVALAAAHIVGTWSHSKAATRRR